MENTLFHYSDLLFSKQRAWRLCVCKRTATCQESHSDDDDDDDDDKDGDDNDGDDMDSQMSINHFIMDIHNWIMDTHIWKIHMGVYI